MSTPACKHEPSVPGGGDPTDTIDNPIDTGNNGGGATSCVPCDPDSVYFQNQILPILVSNCTESGCHNASDHKEGVILTSYQTLMFHRRKRGAQQLERKQIDESAARR
jgi:hypothetical protein